VDDSILAFRDAVTAFGDRIGDLRMLPLAIALSLHLVSLLLRSGIWWAILRAAFPEREVPLRASVWSYLIGVGANAVAPLRGGDVVRVVSIRRQLGDVSVTTVISTLVAEAMFGSVVVAGIGLVTIAVGWLPPVITLPDAKAFELSFLADHAVAGAIALVLIAAAAGLLADRAVHHTRGFRRHLTAGFRIMRSPARFAKVVALPQLLDWALRVAVAYFMLAAFGIPAALRYALLVVVIDSISTSLPFTPGGAGAQQGLLVFALAGAASSGQVLAFSVGAQAVIVAFNVLLGLIACMAVFGHARLLSVGREPVPETTAA